MLKQTEQCFEGLHIVASVYGPGYADSILRIVGLKFAPCVWVLNFERIKVILNKFRVNL